MELFLHELIKHWVFETIISLILITTILCRKLLFLKIANYIIHSGEYSCKKHNRILYYRFKKSKYPYYRITKYYSGTLQIYPCSSIADPITRPHRIIQNVNPVNIKINLWLSYKIIILFISYILFKSYISKDIFITGNKNMNNILNTLVFTPKITI